MNNNYMFSYGMNTNLTQMFLRCNKPELVGVGVLPRYQLNFRYHADIDYTGNMSHGVIGVLWKLSDEDIILRLDELEGHPHYYKRSVRSIELTGTKHEYVAAWTYEMVNKTDLDFPDFRYQDCLIDGYTQNKIPTKQIYDALDRVGVYLDLQEKDYERY